MKKEQRKEGEAEFRRFENLTRNLINVSNVEVREKMAEEKKKKPIKKKSA